MVSRIAKCLSALAVMISLTFTGCMVSPGHMSQINSKTEKVHFEGFVTKPNKTVTIYAEQVSDGKWVKIGDAVSIQNSVKKFGTDWHVWGKNITIPAKCWYPADNGWPAYANVKAVSDGNDLTTFIDGFYDYVGNYDTLEDLYMDRSTGSYAVVFADY